MKIKIAAKTTIFFIAKRDSRASLTFSLKTGGNSTSTDQATAARLQCIVKKSARPVP
jgi:hypothetical protein